MYQITTLSPAAIFWPAISVSSAAVRRMCITGVTRRIISSTAVGAMPSGSSAQSAIWSGFSRKSRIMWLPTVPVVSIPAVTRSWK